MAALRYLERLQGGMLLKTERPQASAVGCTSCQWIPYAVFIYLTCVINSRTAGSGFRLLARGLAGLQPLS